MPADGKHEQRAAAVRVGLAVSCIFKSTLQGVAVAFTQSIVEGPNPQSFICTSSSSP
jgi:hypothetical protein